MTVEAHLPDGRVLQFPEGTAPEVVQRTVKGVLSGAVGGDKPQPDRSGLEATHNIVSGATDSAMSSALFGFGDEINAGMRAGIRGIGNLVTGNAPEFGANYDRALADERKRQGEFAEEHPVLDTVANVAGGLVGGVPGAGVVRGATTALGTVGRAAGTGATYGALGGFGEGEGGFQNRLESAAQGAAAGAAIGTALPVAGKVLGEAGKLASNVTGIGRNDRNVALDHLGRALERDSVDPSRLAGEIADDGKPLALVDQGGKNTQRLGRTVETIPGAGSDRAHEFLNERQIGQGDRVAQDIGEGLSGDNFHKTLEDLNAKRRAEAAPLYEAAYAKPLVWSDETSTLLNRPSTKQALRNAYRIAEEEGRDPRGLGLALDADGNVKLDTTAASMETLDHVKRGLDDVLEGYRDKTTGKLVLDESGRAINQTKMDLVKSIDAVNPEYKAARDAWGGPSQSMEAASLGRQYAKGDPEVMWKRFGAMSETDKEFFRVGVARELQDKVANSKDGHDAVAKIFGSKAQRERLRGLFKNDADFAKFERAMKDEARMTSTRRNVTGNSQTARIAAEQDDAGALGNAVADFATGGTTGALMGLGRRAISKTRGIGEASADELSRMMFDASPEAQRKILAELLRRRQDVGEITGRRVGKLATGIGALSNLSGQGMAED
jgi:hypothetical protein